MWYEELAPFLASLSKGVRVRSKSTSAMQGETLNGNTPEGPFRVGYPCLGAYERGAKAVAFLRVSPGYLQGKIASTRVIFLGERENGMLFPYIFSLGLFVSDVLFINP